MVRCNKRERTFDQVLLFTLLIFLAWPAFGKNLSPLQKILIQTEGKKDYDQEFKKILDLGPEVIPELAQTFEDPSKPWQTRWICSMALGELGGPKAWEVLQKGLNDPLFLVRLASIKASSKLQGDHITRSIEQKLSDKAMVVRSSAVRSLVERNSIESVDVLAQELFKDRNFHRGKSLWIRKNIIQGLGDLQSKKAIDPLAKVLLEKEPDLRNEACQALAKIEPQASREKKSTCWESWMAWYQNQIPNAKNEKL